MPLPTLLLALVSLLAARLAVVGGDPSWPVPEARASAPTVGDTGLVLSSDNGVGSGAELAAIDRFDAR